MQNIIGAAFLAAWGDLAGARCNLSVWCAMNGQEGLRRRINAMTLEEFSAVFGPKK